MAAAVSAKWNIGVTLAETLALAQDNVTDPTVQHKLSAAASGALNATSTVKTSRAFSDDVELSGGTGSLDLTSLAGPLGTTVDFSGLKVNLIHLACPSSNSNAIKVESKDATTGYNLFGTDNAATSEFIEVQPGMSIAVQIPDKLEDVDATHKDIKFAGTGSETIEVLLGAG